MADPGLVGSLNITPPTGQTFAHIKVWADLWGEYEHLVNDAVEIARKWWDAAPYFQDYADTLEAVATDFQRILTDLGAKMTGAAAEALASRGAQIVKHIQDVAETVGKYPKVIDNTGHDIIVHNVAFYEAFHYFHRWTEYEEDLIESQIVAALEGVDISEADKNALIARGRNAAFRLIEENYMIPHQRRLLMILSEKYASKHSDLAPIDIRVKDLQPIPAATPGPGNSGPGANNSSNNNKDSNNSNGLGNVPGTGPGKFDTGPGTDSPGTGPGGRAGLDGLGTSGPGTGTDGPGTGTDGPGTGPGIDVPGPGGLGAGIPGPGTSSTGPGTDSPGTGPGASSSPSGSGSPERQKALEDARKAAQDAIEQLKSPNDSPERARGLADAQKAIDDAIDELQGAGVPGVASSLGTGPGSGSGTRRPATTSTGPDSENSSLGSGKGASDPDAQRVKALKDAQKAIDDVIQDLIDENEASDADPHDKQVRADALRDAQDAAEEAIRGLIETAGGGDTDEEVRADALKDVRGAVDDALDEYEESLSASGIDAHELEVRQDALGDARAVVDEVIDELTDEEPDAGLDTPQEIRGDAHGDARRALSAGFDRLINETLNDETLSDADKLARVDALNDAKNAALGATDELIQSAAEQAETRSELSRFLTTPSGTFSKSTGPGTSVGATTAPGAGLQLGTATTISGVSQSNPGPGAAMHLDAASMPTNQSMPMAPPLGGMGAAGLPHRERERADRLEGEAGVWADDDELSGRAIGRRPSS